MDIRKTLRIGVATLSLLGGCLAQVQDPTTGYYGLKSNGAYGDGSHDDYAAIQTLYTAMAAQTAANGVGVTVFCPNGIYMHSLPLRITIGRISTLGAAADGCIFRSQGYSGPDFVLMPAVGHGAIGVPHAASMATGSGFSYLLNGTQQYDIHLSDVSGSLNTKAQFLDGLAQFDVRFYANITLTDTNARFIVSSQGNPLSHAPSAESTPAFEVYTGLAQNIVCTMNIAGVRVVAQGAANSLPLGSVHVHECSYDGATVRLFMDGVVMASTAATGPLHQTLFQDVTIGNPARFLGAGSFNFMAKGTVDSVQLSDIARNTVDYSTNVPTAKFSNDSHTLALDNFDGDNDVWTTIHNKSPLPVISVFRQTSGQGGAVHMENFTAYSIYSQGASGSYFRNLILFPSTYGLLLDNNGFASHFDTVIFLPTGGGRGCRFELGIAGGGAGNNEYDAFRFSGCAMGVAASGDISGMFNMPFFSENSSSQASIVIQTAKNGDGFTFNYPLFSVESGITPGTFQYFIIAGIGTALTFNGGLSENNSGGTDYSFADFDAIQSAVFNGFTATFGGSSTPFIHVPAMPTRLPIALNGFYDQQGHNVPLGDLTGAVKVVQVQ